MTKVHSNSPRQSPSPPPPSDEAAAPALGRRITGIAALFACALLVDPTRAVSEATSLAQIDFDIALHALVIPALAAVGLWLVLPSLSVLAICVLMLAGAHTEPGSSDLFAGYLYPALTLLAGALLIKALFFGAAPKVPASDSARENK